MAKSLQEQLLAAGAAKPKQAKKARREKTRQAQAARDKHSKSGMAATSEEAALADQIEAKAAAKRAQDRQLNAERETRRKTREQHAAARQIIAKHRIEPAGNGDDGSIYNYTIGQRIRKLSVSAEQRRALAAGRLAIVREQTESVLVEAAVAQRLAALIPERIAQADATPDRPDPDDPYADYVVPDDLMW